MSRPGPSSTATKRLKLKTVVGLEPDLEADLPVDVGEDVEIAVANRQPGELRIVNEISDGGAVAGRAVGEEPELLVRPRDERGVGDAVADEIGDDGSIDARI